MTTTRHVWWAHGRSLANAVRADRRYRIGMGAILVIGVLAARVGGPRLAALASSGATSTPRLWLVCAGVWLSVGLLAALHTPAAGFSAPEAQVLWNLPLDPAARFRVLWSVVVIDGVVSWLVLLAVLSTALPAALGWRSLAWLWTIAAGCGVALWCGIVAMLLVRTRPTWRRQTVLATCAAVALVGVATTLSRGSLVAMRPWPAWIGAMLTAVLMMLLGPLAGDTGRLYEHAFLATLNRDRATTMCHFPGHTWLSDGCSSGDHWPTHCCLRAC